MSIIVLAVCVLVEYFRIKDVYGKKVNIRKLWTNILFIGLLVPVYLLGGIQSVVNTILIRAIFYDILLNVITGKDWNYISTTTNSFIDKLEDKILKKIKIHNKFLFEKVLYLLMYLLWRILNI